MKDSTFIFLIITIVVIFILHAGFKFAEPQEFPKIKVSGVSLMSKSTENYVPWKTEMFTDDLYKSMSEGVEIKFNISIDSGASTIKELSVTRTRKDDSTIEETKTINGPFEDGKSFDFTFTGKGDENFVGEHIFKVKYKLPYGNELELENEFSTTIVGADLSIATEIVKDSAHTLRFETKKKITFDKSLPFEYRGNFSRLGSHVGWEYFNYTILPADRGKAVELCAKKCNEVTEGDGCPGFAIDFRYPRDGKQNIVNCMPYVAKQKNYLPPGREVCRINPELQNPNDGQGPCSTENVMGTYGDNQGGLHWRDLSIRDEVTNPTVNKGNFSDMTTGYVDVGKGHCNTGGIYASHAWALLEYGEDREEGDFNSPLYREYLRRGIQKCNADNNCTHVSVWQNAGYRLYNSTDDCTNRGDTGGIVKSWKKPTSDEESRAAAEAAAKAKAEAEAEAAAKAEAEETERERINNLGTYIVDKRLPFEYRGNFSRLSSQTGWEYTNNMISGPPEDAITKCGEKCNAITEGDGCPGFAIDFRTDGSVNCMTYIAKQASYYNPGREQCRHHPEEQEPIDGQGRCSTQYVMGTHGGYEGGLHWRKSGDAQQAQGGEAQGGEAQGEDVQGDFTASKMDSDISDIEPIPEHCTDENGDLLQDPLIEGSNTKYNPNKTYQLYFPPGHPRHYVHYCQHFIDGPATDNLRDKECARHLCYKTAFGDYGEFEDGEGRGICAGECWDRFKKEPYQDPVSPDCKMTNRSYMPEDWIGWKRWKPQEIYGTDGELTPSSDPGREKAWIAQERKITKAATGDGKKCCEQLGYGSDCEDPLGPDDETVIGGKLFHLERIVTRSNDDEEAKYKGQHLIDYFDNKTGFTGKCDNNFVRAIGEREPPVSMIRVNVSDDPENPIWEDVLPDWVNGDLKGCSPAQQYVAKSIEKDLYELTTDEDKERYLGSAFSDPNAWGEIIGGHLNDYYESGGARQPFWQQT